MQKPTRKFLIIFAWIAVALAIVRVVGIFLKVRNDHQPALGGLQSINRGDPLQVKMQKLGEEAVNIGHRYGMQMDYSIESLDKVDSLLDSLSRDHSAGTVNDEDAMVGCLMWGAYVGEVIRKHHGGGDWAEGPDGTGHGTYPLTVGTNTLYPCRWCVDRFSRDPQGSVSKNYQSFALAEAVRTIKARNSTNATPSSN